MFSHLHAWGTGVEVLELKGFWQGAHVARKYRAVRISAAVRCQTDALDDCAAPCLAARCRDMLKIFIRRKRIMAQAIVGRWGKSLAVRLPGDVADAAGIAQGERVEIAAHDREIVIRRAAPRLTIGDLFRGKSAEEWRALYAGAYDWGPDRGREIVEE
jgi:antitoxin MazE